MIRILRGVPALLVLLVGLLSFAVAAAPVAHAADGDDSWWWAKRLGNTVIGVNKENMRRVADEVGLIGPQCPAGMSCGAVIPPSAVSKRAAGFAGRLVSKVDFERYGQVAWNTAGAAAALGAAYFGAQGAGAGGSAQSPTKDTLTDLEPDLLPPPGTNGTDDPDFLGTIWKPDPGSTDKQSVAHTAKWCGWYATPTGGIIDLLTNTGSINYAKAKVKDSMPSYLGSCSEGTIHQYSTSAFRTLGYSASRTPSERWNKTICGLSIPSQSPSSISASVTCSGGYQPVAVYFAPAAVGSSYIHDGSVYIFEGMDSIYQEWVKDNTRVGVEVTCQTESGTTSKVTAFSVTGSASPTVPSCAQGSVPVSIRQWVDSPLGDTYDQPLTILDVDPTARAAFPECLGFLAVGCAMATVIDGVTCTTGDPDCEDWWTTANNEPDRVSCRWGPYTLPAAECAPIMHVYVEGADGVTAPTNSPGYYPPQPTAGGVPIPSAPGVPLPGGEHGGYAEPLGCPRGSLTTSQLSGLQPVAVEGLQCILSRYPDVTFTSGYRTGYVSADSDHPRGLAVDISRGDWATESGRTRLWEVAGGIVSRADTWNVRYLIFNGRIWSAGSGWVPYDYSGPATGADAAHDNHIHISFGPAGNLSSPTDPAPGQNPYPRPGTETPTAPGTGTGGTPFPTTGTSPSDPENCLSSAWSWNPADWVMVPTKCALNWAFVPSPEALAEVKTEMDTGVTKTGVPTWIDTVETVPTVMGAPDEGTAGCKGPPMDLPDPYPTIYLLEACDGIRATMAAYLHTALTGGIIVWVLSTCTTYISRGFGFDAGGKGGESL